MKNLKPVLCAGFLGLALTSFSLSAHAETIIYDPLTSPPSGSINGHKPTERMGGVDVPDSAYAVYGGTYTAGATGTTPGIGNIPIAELLIPTVTSGYIYTLTLNVDMGTGGDAELGFDNTNSTYYMDGGGAYINSPSGPALQLNQGAGSRGLSASDRGDSQYSPSTSTGSSVGDHTLKLVLDTTGAYYTIAFYTDGTPIGSTYSYSATDPNPVINAIFFGGQGTDLVTNTDFKLIETAAPEPSPWAYLALGLGALAFQLRRRAAQQ